MSGTAGASMRTLDTEITTRQIVRGTLMRFLPAAPVGQAAAIAILLIGEREGLALRGLPVLGRVYRLALGRLPGYAVRRPPSPAHRRGSRRAARADHGSRGRRSPLWRGDNRQRTARGRRLSAVAARRRGRGRGDVFPLVSPAPI